MSVIPGKSLPCEQDDVRDDISLTLSLDGDSQYSNGAASNTQSPQRFKSRRSKAVDIGLIGRLMAHGDPLVVAEGNAGAAYRVGKRLLDIAGATALLVLLSPLLLIVTLILVVTTRGKPFFVQTRVGYLGLTFRMYKFRTMRLDADQLQHLVENEKDGPIFKNRCDPRITRIGRILRKTSIDELPQLINVLQGKMSLVGPRPAVIKEVLQYKPWQLRRLSVMPGLTCLWQVSGRSEIGFEDWMRLDVRYLKKQSLKSDLKLLLKTPLAVLRGRGAC